MRTLVILFSITVAGLALTACDKDKPPTTQPSATANAATVSAPASGMPSATTTAAVTGAATVANDAPTEDDFDDEAEKDVTPANMEAELAKLEKDIGK
jgi:hypothetical protein